MKLLGPMSVKGFIKSNHPLFQNCFFDKVKEIIDVAKVDSVKDLKHCNIFLISTELILHYILVNLGWKCQRFVLNVYI
jgi:hypothetical protein